MKKPSLVRTILLAVSLLLQITTLSFHAHSASGDVDLSFDPGSGVDGVVNALAVQPDGKVIIGGVFSTVKGLKRNGIARLNADGSGDSSFDPGNVLGPPTLSNYVYVVHVVLQPDGKVLVGGSFTIQYGAARNNFLRLNADGSLDNTFNPGVPVGGLHFIVLQSDGKLLIGGDSYYDTVFGIQTRTIYRLNADGSPDSGGFTANPDGSVAAIALQSDGKILITGSFTRVNGISRYRFARLNANGSLDGSFDPGPAPTGDDPDEVFRAVRALAPQPDGKVLIGGEFSTAEGTEAIGLARLNANGSLDTAFNPGGFTAVGSILPQANGKILIGGASTVNGSYLPEIARLNADGSLDENFHSNPVGDGIVSLAARADGRLMIWGEVLKVDGVLRTRVARLDADGILDSSFDPSGVIAGIGHSPQFSSVVPQPDGKVLIGGKFSTREGNALIRLNPNGSADESFHPQLSGTSNVSHIVRQPDGKILIAGAFNVLNATPRFQVARLHSDGTLDTGFVFDPPLIPNAVVEGWSSMALQADGKVIVGGYTTYDYEFFYSRCIRLNSDGSLDPSFSTSEGRNYGAVFALAVQPDGKVLLWSGYSPVGDLTLTSESGGISRLNGDGSHDASFNPGGLSVNSFTLQPDGKILVGGPGYGIRRLTRTGAIDSSFSHHAVELGWTRAFALQPDGKVLIGGAFQIGDDAFRTQIARLNADGTLDNSFAGAAPTGLFSQFVYGMALQADGKVLIRGSFTSVNGVLRPYVVRLHGDSPPPAGFAAWAAGFGLSGAAAAADADPDHDGLASGIEFVLSGNPTLPAASNLPALTPSGGNVVFTFSRNDASEVNGVALIVESGTDLVSWPNVFTIGPDTAASSPGVTIVENGTAPDTINVAIPAGSGNTKFARLKATISPQ